VKGAAANALLNRGWGMLRQTVEVEAELARLSPAGLGHLGERLPRGPDGGVPSRLDESRSRLPGGGNRRRAGRACCCGAPDRAQAAR
jgi:hypothetical protein